MIAFVRMKAHRVDGLYSIEPDGADLRRLDDGDILLTYPQWSPNGSSLLAIGRSIDWSDPADFRGQLNLLTAAGTRTRITEDGATKLRPTWTPDGREIVFERAVGESGYHLFAIRPDGSGLRQITGPPMPDPEPLRPIESVRGFTSYEPVDRSTPVVEQMPAVSPDGSRIIFVRLAASELSRGLPPHHLWSCAFDGSDMRQLTHGSTHDLSPTYAPDGSLVAFTRWLDDEMTSDRDGGGMSAVRLMLMRPDGIDVRALTANPGGYMDPTWAPNGSEIACSSPGPNGTRIVAADVTTRHVRAITAPTEDGDYSPTWQ
jgi:Tol biopolymer transport system component